MVPHGELVALDEGQAAVGRLLDVEVARPVDDGPVLVPVLPVVELDAVPPEGDLGLGPPFSVGSIPIA